QEEAAQRTTFDVKALRETIGALTEQLQAKSSALEALETEYEALKTTSTKTINARDSEVTWLRELLAVRISDLEDIIIALSRPNPDMAGLKDAAVRLKANLEM